jgi:hypothetical protein
LFVVQGRAPARGMSWKGKRCVHSKMLQLQVAGRRETTSRQLSGLQAREGGAAEEEITESSQNHNGKGVHL